MEWKLGALDENYDNKGKKSSLCCFSSPPFTGKDLKCSNLAQCFLITTLEEELEKGNKNYEKKIIRVCANYCQEDLALNVSLVANVPCKEKIT